ncbi:MAG TPA: hypothetical protein VHV47_12640, partial [Opitutaceae bacterium]|nr:hypothetical protein [Opitutaceae bacterium]
MDAALEQRRVSWRAPEWLRGERVYWLLQGAGWGFIILLDVFKWALAYRNMRPDRPARAHPALFLLSDCVVPLGGLLVSHLGRAWVRRRDWKRLPLPALAPRIVLLSLVQGAVLMLATEAVYRSL